MQGTIIQQYPQPTHGLYLNDAPATLLDLVKDFLPDAQPLGIWGDEQLVQASAIPLQSYEAEKGAFILRDEHLQAARLAVGFVNMGVFFDPDGKWLVDAEQASNRALALDAENAEAWTARGKMLWSPHHGFQHANALRDLGNV